MSGPGKLSGAPVCPYCGLSADGYSGTTDGPPSTGALAVCMECARVAVYVVNPLTSATALRLPTPVEQADIDGDQEVTKLTQRIAAHRWQPTGTGAERLPCGCIFDVVEETFVMQPCRPDCEYFQYALTEMRRQGKPIRTIADPELA